jgi:hypothetical protein
MKLFLFIAVLFSFAFAGQDTTIYSKSDTIQWKKAIPSISHDYKSGDIVFGVDPVVLQYINPDTSVKMPFMMGMSNLLWTRKQQSMDTVIINGKCAISDLIDTAWAHMKKELKKRTK